MNDANDIHVSDAVQEVYDKSYNAGVSGWREVNARQKAKNIVDVCKGRSFKKILEIGCGDGAILKNLNDLNFGETYYGLEISKSGKQVTLERGIERLQDVKLFDGYNMPFDPGSFDLVILSHVIEHVEFPRTLLRNMKVLAPYHVFEIPIDFLYHVDQHVDHFLNYGHINIYTPSLFRFLLKSEGYDIERDKISVLTKEVMEYLWFRNMKMPENLSNKMKLKLMLFKRKLRFMYHKPYRKEIMADAYTVLCKATDRELSINA